VKASIRNPLKPKTSTEHSQVFSPQELQIAYEELLITYSDPLTSAFERRLVYQLIESYVSNKVMHSAGSYEDIFNGVQTMKEYDDFKYNLLNDPIFVRSCEAFDKRVEPTSAQDIMATLRLHPDSSSYGMSMFDEIVYYSFISDYREQEKNENRFQEPKGVAIGHFHSMSVYE